MGPQEKMDSESASLEQRFAEAQARISELQSALENREAGEQRAKRTSELNLEKAQSAQRDCEAFSYAIGHDLKQPLRSILTNAQLLERRHSDIGQVKEFASYIVDGANEINLLVDSLVRYFRAGSSLRRSELSLKLPLDLATYKVQSLLKESGASLTIHDLPTANIDEGQFTAVFEQLLTNAMRYRKEGQVPEVHVSAEEDSAEWIVSVADNGQGIEAQYHDQVFEPLKRLHSKQYPGVGLGLSICRKIVGAHGGKIWVESDGEHGSEFKFTVPM